MLNISWPSPLNVRALLSVPDKTVFFSAPLYFCSPQSRTVVDPRTTHFECTRSEQLSLVVSDDSGFNSVASHLFMICKNWHVPKSLYVIRLVYRPRLGRGVPGRNFIYQSQFIQHPVPLKLHHATPSELVWVFWLAYDRVGNSCSNSSNMLAIVCVDRTSTLSRPPKTSTSAQPSVL